MTAQTNAVLDPFVAYAYLDTEHPVVAWNVYRSILVSAQAMSTGPDWPVSLMFAGMIQYANNVRLHNESIIDAVRASRWPSRVSRLSGMYFFTDPTQAPKAETWGGHFRPENLAELEVYPTAEVTRVDSDWITHMPMDRRGYLDTRDISWIDRYWAGEARSSNPVWESIVHGRAVVCGTTLRERAYGLLAKAFPDALDTLEVARLGGWIGADLGQSAALITQREPGKLRLAYYLDMREAEDAMVLRRLAERDGPTNWRDLQIGKETMGMPDFRPYFRDFILSQRPHPVLNVPLAAVHRTLLGGN